MVEVIVDAPRVSGHHPPRVIYSRMLDELKGCCLARRTGGRNLGQSEATLFWVLRDQ